MTRGSPANETFAVAELPPRRATLHNFLKFSQHRRANFAINNPRDRMGNRIGAASLAGLSITRYVNSDLRNSGVSCPERGRGFRKARERERLNGPSCPRAIKEVVRATTRNAGGSSVLIAPRRRERTRSP